MSSARLALKSTHRRLGLWLAFTAGAINAGGFIMFGTYSSHMTGNAASVGDFLALGVPKAALWAFGLMLLFALGACCCALLVNLMRDHAPAQAYRAALMVEAAILALCAAIAYRAESEFSVSAIIMLLCFIMGLQNALITKISGSTIRTTHITGLLTDVGIETGRSLYKHYAKHEAMQTAPDKIGLFGALILIFILGGVVGAFGFLAAPAPSFIALSILLATLAAFFARP